VTQLKPKQTSARFDHMLHNAVAQILDSRPITAAEFHQVLQGFRNKKSIDFYLKLRTLLVENTDSLLPRPQAGQEAEWANNLVNLLFTLISNKPMKSGVYAPQARDEIEQVLIHFEHDLIDLSSHLDADGLTRFA